MQSYIVFAKLPKNPSRFMREFKRRVMEHCIAGETECVIEQLTGRIILFTSKDICKFVKSMKSVEDCREVEIYQEPQELVENVITGLKGCRNFAVRSNRLHVAQEIGGMIHDSLGLPANLENPDCEIYVEFRDGYYLLVK